MEFCQPHYTIQYTGKNVIAGSCLRGRDQRDDDDGYYYENIQKGSNDDFPDMPGAGDYKSCTDFAEAYLKAYSESDDDFEYDDDFYIEYQNKAMTEAIKSFVSVTDCRRSFDNVGSGSGSLKAAVEYTGSRCADTNAGDSGASFTGSSMAALFGLLCISLTLW